MDETHILFENSPSKTIAKQGQETVEIEKKFKDSKSGSTYIASIAMDPSIKIPLYCVAKGTTEQCQRNYENLSEEKCHMDHSKSGWTTVEVMRKYINFISDFMSHEPVALVLDIYKTHTAKEVKDLAASLQNPVENICNSHKEIYAEVHSRFLKIWDNISTSALASAWNIPGLGIDEETVDPEYVPF